MKNNNYSTRVAGGAIFLLLTQAGQALTWERDNIRWGLDSTLSLSSSWRVQAPDESNISFGNNGNLVQDGDPIVSLRFLQPSLNDQLGEAGLPAPGTYPPGAYAIVDNSVCESAGLTVAGQDACWLPYFPNGPGSYNENTDNGNLNFDTGLFSLQYRSSHDFFVELGDVGFFARALLFYDHYIEQTDLPHQALDSDAKSLVGSDVRLLDRYLYLNTYFGDQPFSVKMGKQVITWGESGFISGMSIFQNPRDFNQLIMSGGDLKQASIPTESVWISFGVAEDLNFEGYLKTEWQPNQLPPAGSYFSTADILGAGGNLLCVNGGMLADDNPNRVCATRAADREARDGGEFGFKLSWYVPELNNTEFGFYYLRYHNPSPVFGASEGIPDQDLPASLQAHYYFQYPEDLSLYGFSFSTVASWGTSISGELTYRKDVPLSVDIYEVLGSTVGNLVNLLLYDAEHGGQIAELLGSRDNLDGASLLTELQVLAPLLWGGPEMLDAWLAQQDSSDFRDDPLQGNNCQTQAICFPAYQIPLMPPFSGADVPAFIQRDAIKASVLAIHDFKADWINASHILGVLEMGALYIIDHPDFDELRLLTPGTEGRGVADPIPSLRGLPCCDRKQWSDAFAWGYVLRVSADYNNVFGRLTFSPSLLWQHDVHGTSPTATAGFVEGTQLLRLGATLSHPSALETFLYYTRFAGAEQANQLHDRDFVSLGLNYSF